MIVLSWATAVEYLQSAWLLALTLTLAYVLWRMK